MNPTANAALPTMARRPTPGRAVAGPARRPTTRPTTRSAAARRRMLRPGERPMFLADWTEVLFVHFAVDPTVLQPHVPFALDLFRGRAYVSVVAFTQRNLRPRLGGRLAALASRPLAEHEFLNVRTYVRHGGERGIYFLAEWVPNRLACLLGPRMYGLPYRLARNTYTCRAAPDRRGRHIAAVTAPAGRLAWRARLRPTRAARPARRGLEHFLLERYTAYTRRGDAPLRFRVWHEPWLRVPAGVDLTDTSLLAAAFPWLPTDCPVLAHFSPGVHNVWIGPPRRVHEPGPLPPSPKSPRECPGDGSAPGTWLPPAALLAAALALHGAIPPWAFMWAICFALFFGCKWITWRSADTRLRRNALRSLGYGFAWVGMDAAAFLDATRQPARPTTREWLEAAAKTITGAALLWGLTPLVRPTHDLAAGWLAMTGLVLLLHFGTFHLLSLLWRSFGVDAPPIGGVCHFGILTASALVPHVLAWRDELRKLRPLTRHLVWTHGVFIVLVIFAFGLISVFAAADLAAGTRLARFVCGFIAAFWLARLGIQLFLFDAGPFLTSRWLKLGYHGLTAVFTYLGVVYAWAALLPRGAVR